ncbi:hypothetical protein [Thermomonas sp.]|uniref:hypothetical protein n=1 Tax=Thermomonas sp. TaxID=1971895 RepID=UPI0035B4627C
MPSLIRVATLLGCLAVLAGCASSGTRVAASAPAVSLPVQPATGRDARGSYRFLMQRDGQTMTADQFDAWMRANGIRVARGQVQPAATTEKARRTVQRDHPVTRKSRFRRR